MSSGDPVSWLLIEPGWRVMDALGEEIGKVAEVLGDTERDIFDGLAVSRGILDSTLYLAAERVGRIEMGLVHADVQDASALSEYQPPRP
jgi:hypothetical protein